MIDIAALSLRKGMRVRHPDYGIAVITKIERKTGAVWIRLSDGMEGTCSARILLRVDA
jgi:hypothetical protein